MAHARNFAKRERYPYKDASWQINVGDKVGLIGANGKSKNLRQGGAHRRFRNDGCV
ncbi:MAG: hypothetical protein JJE25_09290 [Bacteroidia bacterium]|nr:hypothetical protein [Bacteroidia bacterium]